MFEWTLFFVTEDDEISYQDLLSNYEMLVSTYETKTPAWEVEEEVIEKWSNQYTSVLHLKSIELNGLDIFIHRVASTRSGVVQPVYLEQTIKIRSSLQWSEQEHFWRRAKLVLGMLGFEDHTLQSFHKNQLIKTLQQNGEKAAVEKISLLIGNSRYNNF